MVNSGNVNFNTCNTYNNTAGYVSSFACMRWSMSPMDLPYLASDVARPLFEWQGGGVLVNSGNVNFNTCNIYSNSANRVSSFACMHWSMEPHGLTHTEDDHVASHLRRDL